MKLYYAPGACSLSPHIVLREASLPFELKKVDLKAKKVSDGADFDQINDKGYVPVLELDDGQFLTEGPAIVQYLADRKPDIGLAPKAGTMERYRLQEWLNFLTAEIHKQFGPLWKPALSEEIKQTARDVLARRFGWLEARLDGNTFLMGERFTVADAYLFTLLNWCQWTGIDIGRWPGLKAYAARIASRPAVQGALKAEGLTE